MPEGVTAVGLEAGSQAVAVWNGASANVVKIMIFIFCYV